MAGEPFAGQLRIADGSGKPDPARMVADDFPYSVQLTKNLVAAVGAHQGMNLVDDDVPQSAEKPNDIGMTVHEHALERFRRDLQNARRIFYQLVFMRGGNVSMPMENRNAAVRKQCVDSFKLVVDKAF